MRYSEEQFKEAIKTSLSIREMLEKLNLKPTGGNYEVAKRRIKRLQINIDHFTGCGHLKGKTHNWAKKTSLENLLVKDFCGGVSSYHLKQRLIKEGLLKNYCYECGLKEWRNKPLSLELEHKNGNRFDNRLENLSLLCPNCHSQTSTYRGKNKIAKS